MAQDPKKIRIISDVHARVKDRYSRGEKATIMGCFGFSVLMALYGVVEFLRDSDDSLLLVKAVAFIFGY